jgi:hypothetical protein
MIVRAAILLVLFFLTPSAGSGEPSELNGIRYNVQPTRSRVTFRFTGAVAYAAAKRDSIITVVFRNVTVGSPPGEARLSFVSGAVQGVRIQRAGNDSAIATIHLRKRDRVEYSGSDDGSALFVDVLGDRQETAAVDEEKPLAHIGESKPSHESPPITADPVTLAVAAEQATASGLPTHRTVDPQRPSDSGVLISVFISLIVATVGTLAILRFAVRKENRKRDAEIQLMDTMPEADTLSLPRVTELSLAEPEELSARFSQTETDAEDPALTLAQRFRRSRSDLDFAIQLSSLPYPNPSGKELIATEAASLSRAQRTILAKRLGVGRGELDLIANLSRMQELAKEKNHD